MLEQNPLLTTSCFSDASRLFGIRTASFLIKHSHRIR